MDVLFQRGKYRHLQAQSLLPSGSLVSPSLPFCSRTHSSLKVFVLRITFFLVLLDLLCLSTGILLFLLWTMGNPPNVLGLHLFPLEGMNNMCLCDIKTHSLQHTQDWIWWPKGRLWVAVTSMRAKWGRLVQTKSACCLLFHFSTSSCAWPSRSALG